MCRWISNNAVVSRQRYCGFVWACWINVHQSIFHTSYWFGFQFALRQISNNVQKYRPNSFCLMASTKGVLDQCAWISRFMLSPPPLILLPYVKVAYFQLVRSENGGPVAQSVYRLATGWTVRGSNPSGARFSAPVETDPGAHIASSIMIPGLSRG
jgi:hypothetical protein